LDQGFSRLVVLKALPVNGRVVLMARPKRCLVADQDAGAILYGIVSI